MQVKIYVEVAYYSFLDPFNIYNIQLILVLLILLYYALFFVNFLLIDIHSVLLAASLIHDRQIYTGIFACS